MINVSKLKRGIVIDHITAGCGFKIFQQLNLDELEDVVVLMKNVDSKKMGKKDLIKIETDAKINMDVLAIIDPGATVTYVIEGELVKKVKLVPPAEVTDILKCKNPRCITNQENIKGIHFRLIDAEKKLYACEYCDTRTSL